MEENCNGVTEDTGDEVSRLQEELNKAKERLQLWKEKTQVGVNELRGRIVELTRQLDESRTYNIKLEEKLQEITQVHNNLVEVSSSLPLRSPGFLVHNSIKDWMSSSMDLIFPILMMKSEINLDIAINATLELEKYKRRTVQTLRLQTKNVEVLQTEILNLQQQLNNTLEELRERNCAVESRDQAISVLQNKLEDLEAINTRLESSRVGLTSKPNVEQINVFEEKLEKEIENVRREFASRETAIFDQHRDEIERLIARHEEEISELRAELEEKTLTVVAIKDSEKVNSDANEFAYKELMGEYETLRDELVTVKRDNQNLIKELNEMKDKVTRNNNNNNNNGNLISDNGGMTIQRESLTLPEALARIAELESGTKLLSQELFEAKKKLIASKHQVNVKDTNNSQILEGQQLSYLKFIVVKLLSANGDKNVAMNLFPVLSTLLHFNSADLKDIYTANPGWVKRSF